MLVYKLQLTGDKKVYWLTEKRAKPIIREWDSGRSGTLALSEYGLLTTLSRIREIRKVEESEPYPPEFKRMLAEEGALALPAPNEKVAGITNLPTEWLILDDDLKILQMSETTLHNEWRQQIGRARKTYYLAQCHYKIDGNEKSYFIDRALMPTLLKMSFYEENVSYRAGVVAVWNYGVKR